MITKSIVKLLSPCQGVSVRSSWRADLLMGFANRTLKMRLPTEASPQNMPASNGERVVRKAKPMISLCRHWIHSLEGQTEKHRQTRTNLARAES
jgi:hypothetical protein